MAHRDRHGAGVGRRMIGRFRGTFPPTKDHTLEQVRAMNQTRRRLKDEIREKERHLAHTERALRELRKRRKANGHDHAGPVRPAEER